MPNLPETGRKTEINDRRDHKWNHKTDIGLIFLIQQLHSGSLLVFLTYLLETPRLPHLEFHLYNLSNYLKMDKVFSCTYILIESFFALFIMREYSRL